MPSGRSPEPIDLLLSDLVMPGMSGVELASAVSTLRPLVPVRLMSGYPGGIGTTTEAAGALRFLEKPFTPEALARYVRAALDSRRPAAPAITLAVLVLALAPSLGAQQASLVYRLGRDTLAVEQFTRTATRIEGEMVQRTGAAVARTQYEVTLGRDGRPTAATFRRYQADGSIAPNAPRETRLRFTADSAIREVVWADSVQRRAFAATRALVNFPTFVYGPTEILWSLRRTVGAADSVVTLGATGNPGFTGLTPAGADAARMRGGAYPMLFRFDAAGRLLAVDGSGTTNKVMARRAAGGIDMAALARTLQPTGTLSVRDVARGAFGAGGMVLVDYGRPMVRDRTVWGGTLVPFDSVWRAGANDATHLFTTRTLTFGAPGTATVTVEPGMYTLWVQHTRTGTFLIINRQTGQWGTVYDPANDVGRVAMQLAPTASFEEELTFTIRALGGNRGALELAWGPSVATVSFGVSLGR